MNIKQKWALLFPILLTPTLLPTQVVEVHAGEVKLEQPKIQINGKGKVDIVGSDGKVKSKQSNMTEFINKYRFVIAGISGVGTVSMILFFVLGFIRLGATSSNPSERQKTIIGLVCSGIGAAGLGAVTLITGLFLNAL